MHSVQLTLGLQHLPFFVQGHGPAIDSIIWIARVSGDSTTYVMSVDGTDFNLNRDSNLPNLCVGSSALPKLGTKFTLAAAETSTLEDLTMLLHFTVETPPLRRANALRRNRPVEPLERPGLWMLLAKESELERVYVKARTRCSGTAGVASVDYWL